MIVRPLKLILLALLGAIATLSISTLSAQPVISFPYNLQLSFFPSALCPLPSAFFPPKCKYSTGNDIKGTPSTITQSLEPQENIAQSLLQQGIEKYEAQQFSLAASLWQQAASAFALQGDNLNQALALSNLSLTYQHLEQWQEAEETITQSLSLLHNHKDADTPTYQEILAKAWNTQGRLQWSKGQLEEALKTWKLAASNYGKAGNQTGVIGSLINQAKALQALGLSTQAQETLTQVNQILGLESDSQLKTQGLRHLGNALRRVGRLEDSQQVLTESLALAESPTTQHLALLELGNTKRALGNKARAIGKEAEAMVYTQAAIEFYQQAAAISPSREHLQPQLNQLSLLLEIGEWTEAEQLWPQIQQSINSLPPSRTAIYARINFARSLACLQPGLDKKLLLCSNNSAPERLSVAPPSQQTIAQILATAVQQAQQLEDRSAQSYALGYLGELYELAGQQAEAQTLTQQALLLAETLQSPNIRYRWEWQLGRLLEKQGDIPGAIAAYNRSVEALESIRNDLLLINSDVQFSFRDNVQPLYRRLVDLLLTTEGNTTPSQENLQQAIRQIDALQLAELENFLGCNLLGQRKIDQVTDPKAAIIYPIILPDRLAVIFELPGQELGYQETPISQEEVLQTLKTLRANLTTPGNTPEVLEAAESLYSWLMKPLEPVLAASTVVETLVFILDGALRNVPMAVLYDGEQYLIEKDYAVAIVPQLQLFSPQSSQQELNVFAGGVGIPQSIDGKSFPKIEKLTEELERIAEQTTVSKPLLNEEFTKIKIEQQLQSDRFSAIHWKTHGVFSSDPEETYIVAYGERIKAQDLNRLIQTSSQKGAEPLELLVLSACETAQGDDRAVLGLAGIAVRTGTRSVLSTLWVAKDAPNTEFMVRFYEELSKPGVTKAQATHQAQLALLNEYGYSTPHIWATYVLVGNWL